MVGNFHSLFSGEEAKVGEGRAYLVPGHTTRVAETSPRSDWLQADPAVPAPYPPLDLFLTLAREVIERDKTSPCACAQWRKQAIGLRPEKVGEGLPEKVQKLALSLKNSQTGEEGGLMSC